MKVIHFSWEFPPTIVGGLGTFTMELTRHLIIEGHEVLLFTLNRGDLPTTDNWRGVEVHRPMIANFSDVYRTFVDEELRRWGEGMNFFSEVVTYNILSASKLINQIADDRDFDLVDAHDWLGIVGGIVAKEHLGIPLVFHVHSTEKGRSMGRGSRTIEDLEYLGSQTADLVITVSYAMMEHLTTLGFDRSKIRVIWNGVDPSKYNPQTIKEGKRRELRSRYGIGDGEVMALFVGRLTEVKGPINLVKALSLLKDHRELKLVILGVGELEERIKKLVKELGLEDRVALRTEFVEEGERVLHYAASDLVVLPSFYEPFGIVCTEAMSMGKPVVVGASGISGFKEQVISAGEEQCGVHVDPHKPEDIAWGIEQVLGEKGELMGANGRKRVLKEFSWDVITRKTIEAYGEVLDRCSG
jgi:glycosyltransferase involved in cell wall biosynthesis